MHALREYIQAQLDSRGWVAADLAKHSGISKQVVSGLLNDDRASIDRLPLDSTIDGLAQAFRVERDVILAKVGEAMGLPMSRTVVVYEASGVPNDVLIQELRRRLREDVMGNAEHPAPIGAAPIGVVHTSVTPPQTRPVAASRTPDEEPPRAGRRGSGRRAGR